jgi:hypothetical protein
MLVLGLCSAWALGMCLHEDMWVWLAGLLSAVILLL